MKALLFLGGIGIALDTSPKIKVKYYLAPLRAGETIVFIRGQGPRQIRLFFSRTMLVFAEYCPDGHSNSCVLTTCDNNTVINCANHPDHNYICTCIPSGSGTGSGTGQCFGPPNEHDNHNHECEKYGHCHSQGKHWHCVNGQCHCYASHHGGK